MIDTDDLDNMSRRDLVELLEAYNESLAEIERLRKQLVTYADFVFWVDVERNVSFDEYERRVGLK